ncbi:alpha/beta hydrolase [Paucibacter sp. APW11]|uniref:Alpha/beta hydrolase n=1 Tax=Roseateles aquae TaxID=3077235 RepID=A0ABU3P6A6_9BURK|nr:alpha/beta hydrolase [Paucibacter sp. APW11]MDT8998089.1 alpha/beta hydrolase [Paucibacter sp. APW11]
MRREPPQAPADTVRSDDRGDERGDGLAGLLLRAAGLLLLLGCLLAAAFHAPERSLQSLVARWAPPPSDFIELKLGDRQQLLHLRDEGPRGDPLPLLLLHGTSASLHTWEGWAHELSKTRRIITIDLPGFGLTGPSAYADYSDERYLQLIGALLDHLQLPRVVLGGNSLGGELAWEYAVQAPERVAALVLVDAAGLAFTPDTLPLGFRLARMPLLKPLTGMLLPRQLVERSVASVYGDPSKITPALIDRYFELTLREGNRDALVQRFAQLEPGRYASQLPHLRQPTLLIWGAKDRLIPLAYGQQMNRAITGSRLVVFDKLGHVPQEEDPAATLRPVQEFLHSLKP